MTDIEIKKVQFYMSSFIFIDKWKAKYSLGLLFYVQLGLSAENERTVDSMYIADLSLYDWSLNSSAVLKLF